MMKALIGRKVGMSQMFSPDGDRVAVTLISCPANTVTLQRNLKRDGYEAVQLGLPEKESSEQKPTPKGKRRQFVARREFRVKVDEKSSKLGVDQFEAGDTVSVVGVSKGKGFQGVVKRHGFKGGPASHGHRHALRSGGSIGSAFPQHVMKGKKMAGRMGFDRVTVKNLKVVWVDKKEELLAVKGAVPGTPGSVIELRGEEVSSDNNDK